MRKVSWMAVLALVAVAGCQVGGCGVIQIPIPVDLNTADGGSGSFDVVAGEPSTNAFTTGVSSSQYTAGSGSIVLSADDITVTPEGDAGGKIAVLQQGMTTLEITASVGASDLLGTICDEGVGDEYGPYVVTLDANYVPVSISPTTISLTQNTINLINSGQVSVCLDVLSPVSGKVTIASFTLLLSP